MLNKVIDYTIVEDNKSSFLVRKVKEHMAQGWVPSGPLMNHGDSLMQVMVKFDNPTQ
jgi:hypothetical protein